MKTPRRQRLRRLLLPLLVVVPIYFVFLAYPPLRILQLLLPHWSPDTIGLLTILVGPACGRLAYEQFPNALTRNIAALTMTWCGVCFIGLMLLLPFELLNLAFQWPAQPAGLYLLAATTAISFIALMNAQRLTVQTVELELPEAPRALQLVQISDVHIGSRRPGFLDRVVAQVNTLPADYVLITGDLIDFSNIRSTELASLAQLQAPALFCIGNHERYVDLEAICQRLSGLGVEVLRNRAILDQGIQFIGIDDADARSKVAQELPAIVAAPEALRILLYHRPDGAEAAAEWGAHLMLCGHTHNGQIVPFNWLVKRQFSRIQGLYRVAGLHLYVSSGTGTWGPVMRLGTACEITLLRINQSVH